jgi:hypothetical protein
VFAAIVNAFKTRYLLSYTPTGVAASGWHPLEVKLKGKAGTSRRAGATRGDAARRGRQHCRAGGPRRSACRFLNRDGGAVRPLRVAATAHQGAERCLLRLAHREHARPGIFGRYELRAAHGAGLITVRRQVFHREGNGHLRIVSCCGALVRAHQGVSRGRRACV